MGVHIAAAIRRMLLRFPWPGNSARELKRGIELLEAGRASESLPLLQRSLGSRADDPQAHSWLGQCHLLVRSFDAAQAHLERAVELRPRTVRYLLQLGTLALVRGDFDRARDVIANAISMEPANPVAHGLLAQAYCGLREPRNALSELEERMTLAAGPESIELVAGMAYDLLGQYRDAAARYGRASGEFPWVLWGGAMGWPPGVVRDEVGECDASQAVIHRHWLSLDYRKAEEALRQGPARGSTGMELAPHQQGTMVARVFPMSPAESAGVKEGDVIVEVAGSAVKSTRGEALLRRPVAGVPLALVVLRSGRPLALSLVPADAPRGELGWCWLGQGYWAKAEGEFRRCLSVSNGLLHPWEPAQLGLAIASRLQGGPGEGAGRWGCNYLGSRLGVDFRGRVVAFWVWPGTPAHRAGLTPGDELLAYRGNAVGARGWRQQPVLDLMERISRAPAGIPLPLLVRRREQKIELQLTGEVHPIARNLV